MPMCEREETGEEREEIGEYTPLSPSPSLSLYIYIRLYLEPAWPEGGYRNTKTSQTTVEKTWKKWKKQDKAVVEISSHLFFLIIHHICGDEKQTEQNKKTDDSVGW